MVRQNKSEKIGTFFKQFSSFFYKKGDVIIRGTDNPEYVYFLNEGEVKQYVITKEGNELLFTIYKPGSFFPMMMEVAEVPNWYYFEAMTDIRGWLAQKEKVMEFIKKEPDIVLDLLERVYKGVDGLLLRMQYLMSGDANSKLVSILFICAKRFGRVDAGGVRIYLKFTHQDLASFAGLSRETVSREMTQLKKQKLINYTPLTITIYNLSALEQQLRS